MLQKLKSQFGIRETPLKSLKSFLSERHQYLNYGGETCKFAYITCRIPQGSSLGPLLFLLYDNDLPTITNFDTPLFADDTYLQMSDHNLLVLHNRVNIELEKRYCCLRKNKLELNYEKASYILVHKQQQKSVLENFRLIMNDQTLIRTNTAKYLGITIDENLTWSPHLKHVSGQLARYVPLFYRIRHYVAKDVLSMLYYGLVYSNIQYGI